VEYQPNSESKELSIPGELLPLEQAIGVNITSVKKIPMSMSHSGKTDRNKNIPK
jgi:hypothetical protein